MNHCRQLLNKEFANRRARNSSYSLRAFARDLGVGVTTLSDFLAEKRDLSKQNTAKVVEALELSKEESEILVLERKRNLTPQESEKLLIEDDQFRLIADWYYFAVLNLARTKNNKADPKWIAQRLAITEEQACEAVERLQRMKFLKIEKKRMISKADAVVTRSDIPSSAIKKHHAAALRLAENSLYNDPVEVREFGTETLAISVDKLPKAKEILRNTRRKISTLLEDKNATEVYIFSLQLFPISK